MQTVEGYEEGGPAVAAVAVVYAAVLHPYSIYAESWTCPPQAAAVTALTAVAPLGTAVAPLGTAQVRGAASAARAPARKTIGHMKGQNNNTQRQVRTKRAYISEIFSHPSPQVELPASA